MRKMLIITNPASRPGRVKKLRNLIKANKHPEWEIDLYLTKAPLDATQKAASLQITEYDLVVAAGGDGTVNEVLNGLVGKDIPFGILRLGSANVFAREAGIPEKIEPALEVLFNFRKKRIDAGLTGGHYFIFTSGFGLDGAAVKMVNFNIKKYLRRTSYFLAWLKNFLLTPTKIFSVKIDNEKFEDIVQLLATNINRYGGDFRAVKGAKFDDGVLEMLMLPRTSKLKTVMTFAYIILTRGASEKESSFFKYYFRRSTQAHIYHQNDIFCQIDGELLESSFDGVQVIPGAIELVVP